MNRLRQSNKDRGVQHLEFVVQQMHTALMTFTRYATNDIVVNSRKNPLETGTTEEIRSDDKRKETKLSAHDHFLLDDALLWKFKRVSNAGSPTCLATKRR